MPEVPKPTQLSATMPLFTDSYRNVVKRNPQSHVLEIICLAVANLTLFAMQRSFDINVFRQFPTRPL